MIQGFRITVAHKRRDMKISKALITKVKGDKKEQKALAIAILLKYVLSKSRLGYFNLNRLAVASGVSYKTLKKYFPLLIYRGYIHLEGYGKDNNNQILVINKLSTRHGNQNCNIDILHYDSLRSVIKSLRAFIVMHLQSKKDYMKQLLDSNHNPKRSDNFKAVRREVRRLVSYGFLKDMHQEYAEYGLSLKRIAKELGCSMVTAIKAVNYAIDNGWLIRHKHYIQYYAKGVYYMDVPWATFSTKNNIYVIQPNTYELTPSAISCFPWLSKAV